MSPEPRRAGDAVSAIASTVDPGSNDHLTPTRGVGNGRFFVNQTFHFQTLRSLWEIPSGGADTGDVLETVKLVVEGDVQSWYAAWSATADRVLALAERTRDPISKGGAYMRAHNYQRTAEFLLPPTDPKRPMSWERCLAHFYRGLDALGVRYERMSIPYQGTSLRALYFPGRAGAEARPLIMLVGGFDSILEELYPVLAKAAHERGYSVLAYEGPGQGQALRQGLTFIPEWERPTGAVLDEFLRAYPRPGQIVLVGMSMGGYFAPRAAAFEPRIHGVVAWDTCFDFAEAAAPLLELARDPIASQSPDVVWAMNNARWTMGTSGIEDTARACAAYTLAPVARQIRQHVLILAAMEDHFIPFHQTGDFDRALVNARSVTSRIFDRPSGGAEHCQTGNLTLVHAAIFDWLLSTWGSGSAPRRP